MALSPVRICASLACADWLRLGKELEELEDAGVDYIHVDIMDGDFVPNFGLNFDLMRTVQRATTLPMDVHLMIERPERYVEAAVSAGARLVTVQQETTPHLQRALAQIRYLGAQPGIALNPATSLTTLEYVLDDADLVLIMTVNPGFAGQKLVPQTLGKIAAARSMIEKTGRSIHLQVDGNVSFEHAPKMVAAGANLLVGGTSSLFDRSLSLAQAVERLRRVTAAPSSLPRDP